MKLKEYFLNESKWKEGDWLVQKRTNDIEYGIVVEIMKNGAAKAISCDDYRYVAKINSTKNWYPAPTIISKDKIPNKILKRIEKKLLNSKYKGLKV